MFSHIFSAELRMNFCPVHQCQRECLWKEGQSITITQKSGKGSQFLFVCTNYTTCRSNSIKI